MATFYFDTGLGFNQLDSFNIFHHDKPVRSILKIPVGTKSIRFDPITDKANFNITSLAVKSVDKFTALFFCIVGITKNKQFKSLLRFGKYLFTGGGKAASAYLFNEFNHQYFEEKNTYSSWIKYYEVPSSEYSKIRELNSKESMPLISVVMTTYNTPLPFLQKAIASVTSQLYTNLELCIADDASTHEETLSFLKASSMKDPRIKVSFRKENGHISRASNTALAMTSGEYVAFLDHDDELHPLALMIIADATKKHPKAEMFYSDEDKIDESNERFDPHFKSDFNYELLLTQNMICHLAVYKASLIKKLGGFLSEYDGAQDYDFALRATELLEVHQIIHIPKVLYHWRVHSASTAMDTDAKPYAVIAGQKAVQDHLNRRGQLAKVIAHPDRSFWNRVIFQIQDNQPSVEIIIPTRDRIDLMRICINSILARTTYTNYFITIVDNGSVLDKTIKQFSDWSKNPKIKVIRDDSPFNYSALNNHAVESSICEYVCLLNNDIEIISPEWLQEMVSHACRPGVGCVGARLWYPDDTLQHGGVIVGLGGVAGHSHKYLRKGDVGYFGRAVSLQVLSCVTAAALLIKRSTYCSVGGLDEELKVAFNDVDFCLRVREAGYRNLWTPFAEMYHHESASRGQEDNPEKVARFNQEIQFMKLRWKTSLLVDPFYSPNLTLDHENFSMAWPPRIRNI
jgi:GT2 family glycosyltransferase